MQAYLDSGVVVLTWDEIECAQQNSPVTLYSVHYNVVNQRTLFLLVTERILRSSQTLMNGKIHIPDLSQRYQFRVAAIGTEFGPQSNAIEFIPATLSESIEQRNYLYLASHLRF